MTITIPIDRHPPYDLVPPMSVTGRLIGPFVIHRHEFCGWTITHWPTDRAVRTVRTQRQAWAIAHALTDRAPRFTWAFTAYTGQPSADWCAQIIREYMT